MLFQSPYLAKLHLAYKETIFCDAIFYTTPSLCYQLLITRIFSKELRHFLQLLFVL